MRTPKTKALPNYVVGMGGICTLFGCSPTTAWRMRKGWLAPAVAKRGKEIVVDVKKAVALWEKEFTLKWEEPKQQAPSFRELVQDIEDYQDPDN